MTGLRVLVAAIGYQLITGIVLGGCQLPLGVACGNAWCSGTEICLSPNSNSAHPMCILATCGNGRIDPGEECDGNTTDGVGCSPNCKIERCGDGRIEPERDEQCDDGNQIDGDGCSSKCQLEECGNGNVDYAAGEQCDLGNSNSNTAASDCTTACKLPRCGDGNKDNLEQCDHGSNNGKDGSCSANCTIEACGNGILDPGEQCDDGNTKNGDGCSASCQYEHCGNGILDPGEQCDKSQFGPGGNPNMLTCDNDCHVQSCGNGRVDPKEDCEPPSPGHGCSATCKYEVCGNGIVDVGEACDSPDDPLHCSRDCKSTLRCGNGIVDPGEQCDDGNQNPSDGCNNSCKLDVDKLAPASNIHIAAADNELYIIASDQSTSASYQLAHVQSGNAQLVNIGIAVMPGIYTEPALRQGITSSLEDNYIVTIPAGKYSIIATGINWQDVWNFSVIVINTSDSTSPLNDTNSAAPSAIGVVWRPDAASMTVFP